MRASADARSIVNLPEQLNRRAYVLRKTSVHASEIFRVLYNGMQSYFTFWRGCESIRRVRRVFDMCHTIALDNQPVVIVHNFEIQRTGNISVVVPDNLSDTHFKTTTYLTTSINMQRFMFQIFAIHQTKKRLIAQINAIPAGSSKLPVPDANMFTVDITEGENDREIELALIFSVTINTMRDYLITEEDNEEDFYDNSWFTEASKITICTVTGIRIILSRWDTLHIYVTFSARFEMLFFVVISAVISFFVTLRCRPCLRHGFVHYLFWMRVINRLSLTLLLACLLHVTLNVTSIFSHSSMISDPLCKSLNYLLSSSSWMIYPLRCGRGRRHQWSHTLVGLRA